MDRRTYENASSVPLGAAPWKKCRIYKERKVIDVMVGSFEGDVAEFYGDDTHDGKSVICRFQWDKTDPDAPLWRQALSPDNGHSWEWNWTMYFSRAR